MLCYSSGRLSHVVECCPELRRLRALFHFLDNVWLLPEIRHAVFRLEVLIRAPGMIEVTRIRGLTGFDSLDRDFCSFPLIAGSSNPSKRNGDRLEDRMAYIRCLDKYLGQLVTIDSTEPARLAGFDLAVIVEKSDEINVKAWKLA